MDNVANKAYLTAIINTCERQINRGTTAIIKSIVLKEVVGNLGDSLDFMADETITESKSTLELNADLTDTIRGYKTSLADAETTITTLNEECNEMTYKIYYTDRKEIENLKVEIERLNKELYKATHTKWDENISC